MSQPTTELRPRRGRWFSYGLRSLFALITVMAVGLAWVASERRQSQREHEIAKQLEASGASVEFAGVFDDPSVHPPEVQPRWRTALGDFLGPRVRNVDAVKIDLNWLCGLKSLEELFLDRAEVSDLTPLAGIKSLVWLRLGYTQVTDLSPLARLDRLQTLNLAGTQVRNLTPLAGLKSLYMLDLDSTQLCDLAPLAGLTNLEVLWFEYSKVSDLSPLAGIKSLRHLWLVGSQVSDEQVELVQQALPNCVIVRSTMDAR